jgi:hypothetical protein
MWRSLISAGVVALVLTTPAGAHPPTASSAQKKVQGSPTVILYQADHKKRAEALAEALGVDLAFCLPVTTKPPDRKIEGLTTLTVWGHGGQDKFCNLDASKFTDLIQAWIEKNRKIKTVEIFTCDARHKSKDNTFDAYSNRVDFYVRTRGLADVTIKALPIGQRGHTCSILVANPDTRTFCYITAKDEQTLKKTEKDLLQKEQQVSPKFHLGEAASKLPQSDRYSLVGGSLEGVRTKLVEVKK